MSTVMSFEQIAAADTAQYKETEAFGGTIRLGSLSAETMLDFVDLNKKEDADADPQEKRRRMVRLIVLSLVDGDAKRLPEEQHVSFTKTLLGKDFRTITRLTKEIMELNGFDADKATAAKNALSEAN